MAKKLFGNDAVQWEVSSFLRMLNPWWQGNAGRSLPKTKRWIFDLLQSRLRGNLAPITVLRGPRQVGKTILQQQLIADILGNGIDPKYVFHVQFDDVDERGLMEGLPRHRHLILALIKWYEEHVLQSTINDAANSGNAVFLFFDEVQNLRDWEIQLKTLVDHTTVKVFVTGSSALRIEEGRDSLAGRISSLELGPLLLREVAEWNNMGALPSWISKESFGELKRPDFWKDLVAHGKRCRTVRDAAFAKFSERGGYPLAQSNWSEPWPTVAGQLNETVVKRAIIHDLRVGERGAKRDEHLLEEVFRLACRYAGQAPGQSVFVPEIKEALDANIGWARIRTYLRFLNTCLLLRLVQPMEMRLKRKRKNADKICLCDHAVRTSWLQENIPLDPDALANKSEYADLAGHIAESVAGYFLSGIPDTTLAHFPERGVEPEVDFVLGVGDHNIPIEIKYRQRIDSFRDTHGLRAFIEKRAYRSPFGLLVTMHDDVEVSDPRIIPLSLRTLLLLR